jgi:hypothetical protein
LRLGKKVKRFIVYGIITLLLISIIVFLQMSNSKVANTSLQVTNDSVIATSTLPPMNSSLFTTHVFNQNETPSPNAYLDQIKTEVSSMSGASSDGIEINSAANSTFWRNVALNAWQYFQPGIGVNPDNGLPYADSHYPIFTDWDLGTYIEAVMSANKIGVITADGLWGSSMRLEMVVNFLETRELNDENYPFWFYQSTNGKHYEDMVSSSLVDVTDAGRLFIALNNLKQFNSSLASRIDYVVYGRSDYSIALDELENDYSASVYFYLIASGFWCFWPDVLSGVPEKIFDKICSGEYVSTYGIYLPEASILCEPLLYSVFELNNDPRVADLTYQVYLAHEARYNSTGEFAALSEGNGYGDFIYEWVVAPDGETWKMWNSGTSMYSSNRLVIYTKVSLSFLALYNTTYALKLNAYLEQCLPDPEVSGYYDGADYSTSNSDRYVVMQLGSNTNGLILSAARYALEK